MRSVHALDLVETVDRLLARDVATQPIHRVGRIADDLARVERVDGATDLPRLRVFGVDLEQHDAGNLPALA
jgi:hypothetical protein